MNPFRFLLPISFCAFLVSAQTPGQLQFKDHGSRSFTLLPSASSLKKQQWIKATPSHAPDDVYWLGSRVVLQLRVGTDIQTFLKGTSLQLVEALDNNVYLVQAPDAVTAANEADRLAKRPEVIACTPVMRDPIGPQSLGAAKPNDPLFPNQWHLENRDSGGTPLGADLNIRPAWSVTRGEKMTIGIADFAVETGHPDLASRATNSLNFNFFTGSPELNLADQDIHATALAGLCVAEMNNHLGVVGVAPGARFASWRIFNTNAASVDQDGLRRMFQYASNSVAVQNHSWAYTGTAQGGPTFVAEQGIDNAITKGRKGKGVVMVRSAGNFRLNSGNSTLVVQPNGYAGNANNDSYINDPRTIAVAAACSDGRVAHYSSPGACILVAAPSSESSLNDTSVVDPNFPTLTTTDRTGSLGYNPNDDYAYGESGFTGTSGVAPQIAGLAAMILSVNDTLTYRDVQQILLLSARHFDFSDPSVETNKAGLVVSHNLGFGIPDAAAAVKMAKTWVKRPLLATLTAHNNEPQTIPDAGYLVMVKGANVPADLGTIPGWMPFEERHPDLAPGEMLRPDTNTAVLPLVDVGPALTDINVDLSNKGALIQRGGDSFYNKIHRAEVAGARFAIVYNNAGDSLLRMTITNFIKIPVIFVGQTAGEALVAQAQTNATLTAQLGLNKIAYTFSVGTPLQCEHVGVQIEADTHARRGDMRITLISPGGTRSILQRYDNGFATDTGPPNWTYWTTHNFFESSVGTWTVQFSDEQTNNICSIVSCSLIIKGTIVTDKDRDGLSDAWEIAKFRTIKAQGPQDDPDHDGVSNLREMLSNMNPNRSDAPQLMTQPGSRTVFLGASNTFTVVAKGSGPLLYQWRFEGADIARATNSSFTLTNVDYANMGSYSVVVDNLTAAVTTSNAVLRVILANDLDGDRNPDLLTQSPEGVVQAWNMSSTNLLNAFLLNESAPLPPNSQLVAQADFNGDGLPDLVIQSNGLVSVWLMNGTNQTGVVKLKKGALSPITLKVVGSADFNRDGYPDLLLQQDRGPVSVWQMKGTNYLSTVSIAGVVTSDMKVVAISDFNKDGFVDLLFQSTKTGNLTIWFLNKFRRTKTVLLANAGLPPGEGWVVGGAVDLSGDGNKDLIWQNTNGNFYTWFMNGTNVTEANDLLVGPQVPGLKVVGRR